MCVFLLHLENIFLLFFVQKKETYAILHNIFKIQKFKRKKLQIQTFLIQKLKPHLKRKNNFNFGAFNAHFTHWIDYNQLNCCFFGR